MNSPDEVALWATSGAMAITGLRDGTPLVSTGRPATAVTRALRQVTDSTALLALTGHRINAQLAHTWRLVDELT
ncbi:hypothetical protein VSH64_10785 [Amycolatopsis rhabdoformis]|uniref:Uncharacterized protein n=1 Tax=Amycolatopsis rhabdoformis TaxID=1448059 RepID=A0ABZ1IFR6_9PSEU|nr:hypothetical protein [Amycolatopsis rhabdoformis]WSE32591.1 hypothetical protein VSH64_10785 [Amycolatopsis rhabdoformis]